MSPTRASLEAAFTTRTDRELLGRLDIESVPRHVAIIMDGNGRWASKRGVPRILGHRAGAKAIRESIAACIELGIEYLTIYSFSSENWRRSAEEVSGLMGLFVEVLEAEIGNLHGAGRPRSRDRQRRGHARRPPWRPSAAPSTARRPTARSTWWSRSTTAGAWRSPRRYAPSPPRQRGESSTRPAIDEDTIAAQLYTAGVPDPDLIVRTSGEMRISNFLLWQLAYSEIWVTATLWPDFKRGDLLRAVVDFQKRSRRFGGR